jgi:hypothetical protein
MEKGFLSLLAFVALVSFRAFGISLDWIELWRFLAWLDEPLCQDRL